MSSPAPVAHHPGARALPELAWKAPLAFAGAVALGALVTVSPKAAITLAAVPVGLLALRSAQARVLIVVFGGMLVLDRTSGFDYGKALYLAGLALCVGAAWQSSARTSRDADEAAVSRAAGIAWCVMVAVVVWSFPVAWFNGHPPSLWLRDVAPYLMLAATPILAVDASRLVSRRFLIATFIAAGLLGTASMTVNLIGDRELASLPVSRLAFGGFLLPVCLFAYASARALRGPGDRLDATAWAALASGILAIILLSGTRAGLLLLVAPVAILLSSGGLRGIGRALAFGAIAILLLALAFRIGAELGLATDQVRERLESVEAALRSPDRDSSLADRLAQTRLSWDLFTGSPFLGVGPGHLFRWDTGYGVFHEGFSVDSSLSTLAKFGVLGTLGFVLYIVTVARLVGRVAAPDRAAIVGLAAVVVGYLALSNPFEDKGLTYGLLFLLALALPPRAARASPAGPPGGTRSPRAAHA